MFRKKAFLLFTGLIVPFINVSADDVVNDDLIANQSLCIGQDCTNGEVFDFSTIILKENNLQIYFNDTSNSGSFPSNDWKIIINDSANGGEEYFAIEDVTNDNKLFKIKPDGNISMGLELSSTFNLSSSGDLYIKGTLSDSSDINLKENITPIDPTVILQKIETLPISIWNYKENKNKEKHIGSMAQDFYKAFEFGPDDKHIAPKDAAFVAMAGVQELLIKLKQKDKEIEALKKSVERLEKIFINLDMKKEEETPALNK